MENTDQDKSSSVYVGEHLHTYTQLLTDVIDDSIYSKGLYIEQPYHFFYTIIHKLRNLLDVVSFLVTNKDEKGHYTDSIYLLLRTALMDSVCLYFVIDEIGNGPAQDFRISRILFDHVRAIHLCAQDEQEKQAIREKFPNCFNSKLKFKKEIVPVGIKNMHDELQSDLLRRAAAEAMYLYNIFSKIEHNGIMTFSFLHDHFYPGGNRKSKIPIYHALKIIMEAVNLVVIATWAGKSNPIVQRMTKMTAKIVEAIPNDEDVALN